MFAISISTGNGLRLHSTRHETWNAGLPVITTIKTRYSFNHAAMGQAWLLIYPCFFVNRTAMDRVRFMFYQWFFFSSATRPRPPLGQLWITQSVMFTHQTLSKHRYIDNATDIVFFILWKTYFLLVLIALDSKGIRNTLKRYYIAM